MTEIVNLGDIIANHFNQDKTLQETAADLGAIILEMNREKQYYGERTKRMAELEKLAEVQKRVVSRMLDNSINKADLPKRPRLTVVK